MTTGQRFKFHGSTISVLTALVAGSPVDAITAITQANPAVVTEATHGRADGDVVSIESVVGMTEVNDKVFIINVLNANTYELVDTDSSGYTAYSSGGTVNSGTFSNFCELTGYNRTGGSSPEIDATTICSTEAEYELGLSDRGTTQFDHNFAPGSTIQTALNAANIAKNKIAVKVVLPNSGGTMIQLGFVQQMSEQAANGTLWTASTTLRNTGGRYDVPA